MEDAGLQPKQKDSAILAALPYILGWIVGLLIYLIAKEDKYARYHALQAILFGICLSLATAVIILLGFVIYIPVFVVTFGLSNCIVIPLFFLLVFCLLAVNLYFAYLAYKGKAFMLPFIGKIALDHIE